MGAGGGCSPEGCSAETVATVARWGECMPGHSLPSCPPPAAASHWLIQPSSQTSAFGADLEGWKEGWRIVRMMGAKILIARPRPQGAHHLIEGIRTQLPLTRRTT